MPDYQIELTSPTKLFDGHYSWAHPRAGVIPAFSPGNETGEPIAVMTLQKIDLSGSDVFSGLYEMRSDDGGNCWTEPAPIPGFARRPFGEGQEITVCDFTPGWHAASGKLLGTGISVCYENNRQPKAARHWTAYAFYDPLQSSWSAWQKMELPDEPRFAAAGAGSTQRFDLPDGDILLPIHFKEPGTQAYGATIVRCRFDGTRLRYIEHGSELTVPVDRGFCEPSITQFGGRFYLTLRNDQRGFVASSADGLHYDEPKPWTWDDGSDLGNYNTQQHWVTHRDGLFLVYTRRAADNDRVFRHRAPLFIAQVDPDALRVIRSSERILMPDCGARLGNFAVTHVTPLETWVTDAEWMQPRGCEKYGAEGRVWVSKIRWSRV